MKVKVIRQFLNGSEVVPEGTMLVVTERRAKALMGNNLVAPAEVGGGSMERRAVRRTGAAGPTVAKAAIEAEPPPAGMTEEPPTGGLTGEETQRSSSPRGRPRGRPRSMPVGAEHDSSL